MFDIVVQELITLYSAYRQSKPSPYPELPVQYADFAIWQRAWLQEDELDRQFDYWREQLADAPTFLNVPTDFPRPLVQSFSGDVEQIILDATLTRHLLSLSIQANTTIFITLLTAFQVVLCRYTGQSDFLVGIPIASRQLRALEPLIGFFVNTLVLRANLTDNPTFLDLLTRTRQTTFEAYDHQDMPFEQLVNRLPIARSLHHNPLVQVMFNMRQSTLSPVEVSDLQIGRLEFEQPTVRFDLEFEFEDIHDELVISCCYNASIFEATTIQRLLGHVNTLLEAIVIDPHQSVAHLPMLSEAERHHLLVVANDTATADTVERSVAELFEAQVERSPEAMALVFGEEHLTYRALNGRANQVARYLQTLGVGPEVMVGLCMERSVQMVVGLLGILKAGGAYLSLDPDYPAERLAFMLADAHVPALLTQERLLSVLPETSAHRVCLDRHWPRITEYCSDNLPHPSHSEHLAYVIFTSGSTGQPKGVMIPHRAINRLILNTNYIDLTATDRIAQASNASFDAAIFEIWGALLHGAKLIGIPREVTLVPKDVAAYVQRHEISVLFLTTALFNQIARTVPYAFQGLRYLLFGGEAVDPSAVSTVLQRGSPKRLLHVYGPTESTTFTSWYLVEDVAENRPTVPIGRPLSNTQIYVLDTQLQTVPVGVAGELYIGGDGLAHGYHNRPGLTCERFIPNPFGAGRLYKTGDQVRYLPNDQLEFLGRLDNQVKLRGFRIELGEIEVVLSQHRTVHASVVVIREEQPGYKHLVAYVVATDASQPSSLIPDLRDHLKQRLPAYMMPAAFVLLERLPLTPNGKVDRRVLPAPESMRLEDSYVPPRTSTEETLAAIWSTVLGIERVGVHDDFFDLGGHSLLATQVTSRIQEAFQLDLPVRALFESSTLIELAERIEDDAMVLRLQDLSDTTEEGQEIVI